MYIEAKETLRGGVARIGWVSFSRTGRTAYYGGRAFQRFKGFKANYFDIETGAEFWISGPKRDGSDRLYDERVPVDIDDDARHYYWTEIRREPERCNDKVANR